MAGEFDLGALTGSPTFQDFVGNTDNSDTYSFTLSGVTEFSLLLNGMTQNANVYLHLDRNSNGQIDSGESIDSSDNYDTSEDRISRTLGAGTYFVEVDNYSGWSGSTDTRYNLNLSATPTGIGDIAPNDSANAFNVGALEGTQIFQDFVGNADGVDYYRFNLGGVADFSLTLNGLEQNANVYLHLDRNSNGQIDSGESIDSSDNYDTSEDRISRTLGAGTYFVEVDNYSGWSGSTDTRYNLNLFTTLSASGILADNTLLNYFGNLVGTAAVGAAGNQFFDLSDGGDTRQLELGWNEQFRGGLRAFGGNDNITGTSSWDIINGNQGADILRGGGGYDFLRGGRDDDQVFGDDGDDLLNGNFGNDVVDGGAGNDFIRGGRDNDNLRGGDGNDVLVGDFGFDILTGGGGADTFIFRADTETGTDAGIADTIADFSAGDRIIIAGNVSLSDISVVDGGGNAIIQLNTGAILGVALNTSAAAVQGVLGTAGLGDSGLKVG